MKEPVLPDRPGYPTQVQVILVVGNLASWRKAGREIPKLSGFHFACFADVTNELMQAVSPDLVLSALIGDDYDVVDLARRLAALDFVGRYRALTSGLPNPRVVMSEVQAAAPGIDFDLFDLDNNLLAHR